MLAFIEFETRDFHLRFLPFFKWIHETVEDFSGNVVSEKRHAFRPWVAEITDFDPHYGLKREFVDASISYSRANRKLSRGVYMQWWLESGSLYQVYEGARTIRYFYCQVNEEGEIIEISEDEASNTLLAAGKDPLGGKELS